MDGSLTVTVCAAYLSIHTTQQDKDYYPIMQSTVYGLLDSISVAQDGHVKLQQ